LGSFREYLNFTRDTPFESLSLKEVLNNHEELALEIDKEAKPLIHFLTYLRIGYFPFFINENLF
jgi:uncharacterized protein